MGEGKNQDTDNEPDRGEEESYPKKTRIHAGDTATTTYQNGVRKLPM